MITKNSIRWRYFTVIISLLAVSTALQAQGADPSKWTTFVSGKDNPMVQDTFRLITFSEPADPAQWEYEVTGTTALFDPKEAGIADGSKGNALLLKPGSSFSVRIADAEGHSNYTIQHIYAAWNLSPGEQLLVTAERSEKPIDRLLYLDPPNTHYRRSFKQMKEGKVEKAVVLNILKSPSRSLIEITEPAQPSDGFYALDSVYAFGKTERFSLFTGAGSWHQKENWTHQPALRHRHALINGHVRIDQPVSCNRLIIGYGSVEIESGQEMSVDKVFFCGSTPSLVTNGTIDVRDNATVYPLLEEKGKWYFISFPFDVYPSGIDPDFQLKDATPNEGGNFFYLYTYNGEKRASGHTQEGNWEVVSLPVAPDRPLFEKGKGYLIALDEKAKTTAIRFFSAKRAIPSDFGRRSNLSVPVSSLGTEEAHKGWYLCGNPLPGPLPLRAISSTQDLDGYVYVYKENGYVPYAFDSDYALPPFTAFFVKAERETQLEIDLSRVPTKAYTLIPPPGAVVTRAEPSPTSSTRIEDAFHCFFDGYSLHIEALNAPGNVSVWDFNGRLYWKERVAAGSSVIPLPSSLPAGSYILSLESNHSKSQYIFNRNEVSPQ